MSGKSGRRAQVKVSGAAVTFTTEATTTVTANTVYQITDATKRVWDPTAAITVYKDAVSQSPTLYTINRLTGTITFTADQGASVITVSGSYLPLSLAAEAKEYSYDRTAQMLEDNAFGDSDVTRVMGLQDVSGTIGRWWSVDTYFTDALLAGNPVVIEFWSDSTLAFDRRCWALLEKDEMKAAIEGLIEESVTFNGTPDADGRILSS